MLARTRPLSLALLVASLALAGCAGAPRLEGPTGSIVPSAAASTTPMPVPASSSKQAAPAPARDASPPAGAIALARELRAKGDRGQALAELEKARRDKPADRQLAREAGLIALELGQLEKARKSLEAAHDPAQPDWHTVSALGTAYATEGNQREAQQQFKKALELRPAHQPTLNNLALSFALEGKLDKAEATLRSAAKGGDAAATAKVKENLALVMALAGKYADAEEAVAGVMPKAKVVANLAYLKSLREAGG